MHDSSAEAGTELLGERERERGQKEVLQGKRVKQCSSRSSNSNNDHDDDAEREREKEVVTAGVTLVTRLLPSLTH